MSKVEQNQKAKKIKKELKRLGVTHRMFVEQNSDICDTIELCIYDKKIGYADDDTSFILSFNAFGDITGLFYNEGSPINNTISYDPSLEEIANYLKGSLKKV